jgi:pimeloyl-ACP methyl ester carboxylesterase
MKKLLLRLTSLLLLVFVCSCIEKEKKPRSGTVRAGGLQVYYERHGRGTPLLLVHAGLQNNTMWSEQVKALSPHFEIITVDLPFHGRTEGKDTSILASDVIRIVLDSLGIEKTAVAGLSMGASVAQELVLDHPSRVTKAIFISTGINGYEKKYPLDAADMMWYSHMVSALTAKDTARAALLFSKAWGEGLDARDDSLRKPSSRYVYNTTLATLRKHKLLGWPNLRDAPTAFDRIGNIKIPVLVIHGDRDLSFITQTSQYLEKTIPGSRRVLIKGVAHMLNMEQPAEVNRLIREFLDQ